ncbi:enoyl-CoA hydratase-related protein [Spiractinospora alimapuensis]|uniref:enoyl-CoA hydratase-related protein n=1 Tax=Spiractinospora alimapuensis TaxID=2820884 RepID=UPI001F16DEA7|nr:enoyl-CoA hydratase-related protein [Spiractinospora alimapuensis]
MSQPVLSETSRGIATITLNSPERRNALSAAVRIGLARALAAAMADDSVRAVVLTAAGPAFCAGVDLKEVAAERAGRPADPDAPTLSELLHGIGQAPKPVVTAVQGPARAGGVGIVAASDIAIAVDSATFAFTEVRIGVVPAVISVPVGRRMHQRPFERYFLTGEVFSAREAADSGLVTETVPDGELTAATERVVDGLRQAAPAALMATKAAVLGADAAAEVAAYERMGKISTEFFASEDAAEGRAAFQEKRAPRWAM